MDVSLWMDKTAHHYTCHMAQDDLFAQSAATADVSALLVM